MAVASTVSDCMEVVNTMRLPRLSTRAASFITESVSPSMCMKQPVDMRPSMLAVGIPVSKMDLQHRGNIREGILRMALVIKTRCYGI